MESPSYSRSRSCPNLQPINKPSGRRSFGSLFGRNDHQRLRPFTLHRRSATGGHISAGLYSCESSSVGRGLHSSCESGFEKIIADRRFQSVCFHSGTVRCCRPGGRAARSGGQGCLEGDTSCEPVASTEVDFDSKSKGTRKNETEMDSESFCSVNRNDSLDEPASQERIENNFEASVTEVPSVKRRKNSGYEEHESFDYLPGHSQVYQDWLKVQPVTMDWCRWLTMGVIGVVVGIVGVLLHQVIHLMGTIKWKRASAFIQERNLLLAWSWAVGCSVLLSAVASFLIVFLCPYASGSGIPEMIGFLNGTVMRRVLSVQTFVVKFVSCCCAVGAGLPVGSEGPMIHIGGLVGNGVCQFRSRTFNFSLPIFTRFRNSEDRRDFTTAGVAAGVAAAFGAPIGGLLFALEEIASFWTVKLGSMIFFSCTLATVTSALLNSVVGYLQGDVDQLGLLRTEAHFLFKMGEVADVSVVMFVPAVGLGIIGGCFGALFTLLILRLDHLRRVLIRRINRPLCQKIARVLEPPTIMFLWTLVTVFLPSFFPCRSMICRNSTSSKSNDDLPCLFIGMDEFAASSNDDGRDPGSHGDGWHGNCSSVSMAATNIEKFWCRTAVCANESLTSSEYNEAASLLCVDGLQALRLLLSRGTHMRFGCTTLVTALLLHTGFTCWAATSSIASGIVIPMMFIGGLYGRTVGRLLIDLHGGVPEDRFWRWVDPGAMALVGAASFFAGVSRLTVSLTVIMVEMTNDASLLLPTMVAILISKWVADCITKPLYHSLLLVKRIPYLDAEPIVHSESEGQLNLALYSTAVVMHSPVVTVTTCESVSNLASLVLETSHGGYPVVKYVEDARKEVLYGLITRQELCTILMHNETRLPQTTGAVIRPRISFEELFLDLPQDGAKLRQVLEHYSAHLLYKNIFIDLDPFVNRSPQYVREDFSLQRSYSLFRALGLRHLIVVDMSNQVVGIVTRKDLMQVRLEEKLQADSRGVRVQKRFAQNIGDNNSKHGEDSFV